MASIDRTRARARNTSAASLPHHRVFFLLSSTTDPYRYLFFPHPNMRTNYPQTPPYLEQLLVLKSLSSSARKTFVIIRTPHRAGNPARSSPNSQVPEIHPIRRRRGLCETYSSLPARRMQGLNGISSAQGPSSICTSKRHNGSQPRFRLSALLSRRKEWHVVYTKLSWSCFGRTGSSPAFGDRNLGKV